MLALMLILRRAVKCLAEEIEVLREVGVCGIEGPELLN